MTNQRFIGICYYCKEEVLENELKIYNEKPFHKKCVDEFIEIGEIVE